MASFAMPFTSLVRLYKVGWQHKTVQYTTPSYIFLTVAFDRKSNLGSISASHVSRPVSIVDRCYRVGQIMLNSLPIMLFQYAQNSTCYAANYAPDLPIMLKLCPLFLEGANRYVLIIIILLLSYVQGHNCITNFKAPKAPILQADYMDCVLFL